MQQRYFIFETVNGFFCAVAWSDFGIGRFQLPTKTAEACKAIFLRRTPDVQVGTPPREVVEAIDAANCYFQGEKTDFTQFDLDLSDQDPFFKQIYDRTRKVEWGQTTTYGNLAKELGAGSEAARDVGMAMAKNPVPLIIPCHRVLAAGGKVSGFSAPGGQAAKIRMLALEGVQVASRPASQQSFNF